MSAIALFRDQAFESARRLYAAQDPQVVQKDGRGMPFVGFPSFSFHFSGFLWVSLGFPSGFSEFSVGLP